MTVWGKLNPLVTADCSTGEFQVETSAGMLLGWAAYRLHLKGKGLVNKLVFALEDNSMFEEIFLPAPNNGDICYAHRSHTLNLGFTHQHQDRRFGDNWFFTPPPFVLPVRIGNRWYGMALGAEMGKNHFSSWTYRPSLNGQYQLEILYDGYYGCEGEACTLFFDLVGEDDPYKVIAKYASMQREIGWAPQPERNPALWWKEPFLCVWGDQCAVHQQTVHHPTKERTDHVSTYDNEMNQRRWLQTLLDHEIPVGVVSLSDKWQKDRYRLVPDLNRYPDLRGFADWHHQGGRHLLAWWGLWAYDGAPAEWCIRNQKGEPIGLDPENEEFRKQLSEDIHQLLSPEGYDLDGFFLDFTGILPIGKNYTKSGQRWGLELLHCYLELIYTAAKLAKPDAMVMTNCPHPYFADVTDVLRLNDWAYQEPNIEIQAKYRTGIVRAVSDWLVNTDNWWMYDIDDWRKYMRLQPELGIPATWYTQGVWGEGVSRFDAFTEEDYREWAEVWKSYRIREGLVFDK